MTAMDFGRFPKYSTLWKFAVNGAIAMKRAVAAVHDEIPGAYRTLGELAYARLREDIVWGRLAPGDPLRSDDLRHRYGLGVSPLREALAKLAVERLVIAQGQRGYRVAPVSPEEARDVLSVRLLIEGEALARSMRLGGVEWESAVMSAFHRLARMPLPVGPGADPHTWAEVHRGFHMALLSACDSPWLLNYAANLYDQAERYRLIRAMRTPKAALARDVAAEHRELLDAVLSRDAARAARALHEHYSRTIDAMVGGLAGDKRAGKSRARASATA
jgi:DNA-binding GntR family transcriptional regulator